VFGENTDIFNKDHKNKKTEVNVSRISEICKTIDTSFQRVLNNEENEYINEESNFLGIESRNGKEDGRSFLVIGNKKIFYSNNATIINDVLDHDLRKNLRM